MTGVFQKDRLLDLVASEARRAINLPTSQPSISLGTCRHILPLLQEGDLEARFLRV